jgi:serine/threonine protein kinase
VGSLRLHERLVSSGSTTVHLGWLVRRKRLVAVKRLHPLHVAGAAEIARVREEARLAMGVEHANVVATFGVVHRPAEMLAAMEYVPGASLAELTSARSGGLAPPVATAIVAGALRGLHAAHEARASAVPRCASARRILVGEDGRARVIGFDVRGPGVLRPTEVVDELPYAAPEQLLRRGVDARRDVYGAAVVLWETLTGRPLFHGPTVERTLRRILSEEVPAPSRFAPRVGAALDAVVLKGLARDPGERYASASAMAGALVDTGAAEEEDVARVVEEMDLGCVNRRRALADAVRQRESRECRALHTECNEGGSKRGTQPCRESSKAV